MSFITLRRFSSKIAGFGNKGVCIRPQSPRVINTIKFGGLSLPLRQYSVKKYTKEHEWISVDDNGVGIVGITDYAQNALGDVVYVEIPEVGKIVQKSENIGAVESVKAASDIYAPVSGEVIKSNDKLTNEPGLINKSAEGDGWLCEMKLSDTSELDKLLDEQKYIEHCSSGSH